MPSKEKWAGISFPSYLPARPLFCDGERRQPVAFPDHLGDLQAVINRWHDLPKAIKAGILAMVNAQ